MATNTLYIVELDVPQRENWAPIGQHPPTFYTHYAPEDVRQALECFNCSSASLAIALKATFDTAAAVAVCTDAATAQKLAGLNIVKEVHAANSPFLSYFRKSKC